MTAGAPTAARVLLKQRSEDPSIGRSSISTGLATGSPTSPSEDASATGRVPGTAGGDAEDDHSDKGTYTIELENKNQEEEEARRMIDKVGMMMRLMRGTTLQGFLILLHYTTVQEREQFYSELMLHYIQFVIQNIYRA